MQTGGFLIITIIIQRFPQGFVYKSPWDFHGLFGGPTDRVGDSFNFFVRPLSKLCVSDAHLCIREKHDYLFNPRRYKLKKVIQRHKGGSIGPLPSTFNTIHPID